MSIVDGQRVRAQESNAAWASKQSDNTFEGVQSLENVSSGGNIANVQQTINNNVSNIASNTAQLADLQLLSGEVSGTTEHTGFTGSTFNDGSTRNVLQEAETAIEARIPLSQKGAANGVAELDGSGTVPASQLPSYVDDVLEFADFASFPVTGETGKIYIAIDTSRTYRWTGSVYLDITGNVDSVNGQTGTVVLNIDDINDVAIASLAARDVIRRNPGDTAFENFNPNQIVDDSTSGSNVTLASVGENSIVRLTSGTLVSVDMIPAGYSGQKFIIINRTGVQVSISNETGATAANQIITGTGANLALEDDASLVLTYDATTAKWQIVGGSGAGTGANDTLSNLVAPTAVNETLNMDATKTVIVENNVAFQGKDTGGTARNFIKMRTDNDMELGFSGANLNVQCPNIFRSTGSLDLGTSPNPINQLKLTFMGSQLLFNGNHANILTQNAAATDRIQIFTGAASTTTSGLVSIESGGAQTDSGIIDIKTGASTAGNSGNILLTTGAAGAGTRGDATIDVNKLNIKDSTLSGASVGYIWKLQNATTGEGAWAAVGTGTVTIQEYFITQNGISGAAPAILNGTGEIEFDLGAGGITNDTSRGTLITASDDAGNTRTLFTAGVACEVAINCYGVPGTNGAKFRIFKNGTEVLLGHQNVGGNIRVGVSGSLILEAAEFFTVGIDAGSLNATVPITLNFVAKAI